MNRHDIINTLIKKFNYKRYLEIGTWYGHCYTQVHCEHKECVDPKKLFANLTHEMTSDEFFNKNKNTFDIIFVDGLHTEEQTTKDVLNSLKILNPNGRIVMHDCLPHSEDFTQVCHSGTVYRSVIDLRCNYPDVSIEVVDTDCGCGIVSKNNQELYTKVPFTQAKTYEYYNNNKKDLMNIITVQEFNVLYS
jgi:predicted O-methyltransferase YrrM